MSALYDDDGIDGPLNREMERLTREDAKKPKRARKPKVSPFARAAKKIDAAVDELREEMRKIDPQSPLARRYLGGHWYYFTNSFGRDQEVHVDGPWCALTWAEWAAALFDGIRSAVSS